MIISIQFHKVLPNKKIYFTGKQYDFETDSDVSIGDIVRMWQDDEPIFHATRVKIIEIKNKTNMIVDKVECVKEPANED